MGLAGAGVPPLGVAAADVVVTERRENAAKRVLVVDDYQANPATNLSSSGGPRKMVREEAKLV